MAVVVVVVDKQTDADQAELQWTALGYKLLDVGALPTGFSYFESLDMTAALHHYASKYVLVFSNA